MTEALATSKVNAMRERRSTLISRIMYTSADSAKKFVMQQEIKRITMLGNDKELEWVMTRQGLIIKTPEKKGNYAYVFKIERYHHPVLD